MSRPFLEIRNLSFSIGGKTILRSVSLDIHEGEYLAVIGPNGAGKTTLLKCIMRIFPVGKGVITIDGVAIERYSQKELARRMSYVPQSDGRFFPFTVEEFVLMGRYPHLSPFTSIGTGDKASVREAMAVTRIAHLADRHFNTLSGGEKQMVFIAAALAQGSKILLLDEPATFLDPKHESEIYRILKSINRDLNVTIVSVTHDINSAALQGDRVVIIKDGAVIFHGNAMDILDNTILENAYGKTFTFARHPESDRLIIVPDNE